MTERSSTITYSFRDNHDKPCLLVVNPDAALFEGLSVVHPGSCGYRADVSANLDAFYCTECRYNGRISGAWAVDMWMQAQPSLSFGQLRHGNVTRCRRWHPGFLTGEDDEWTGADWSNAMCGEAGEAANVVKKIRRVETGTDPGPDDPPYPRLMEMLADELADVVTYCDLLAAFYDIDLGAAVVDKFNRVSERQGFPDRLLPQKLEADDV
jgi:NTP pyrophosphatase (non-canonical NTP hydrolase)